MKLGHLFLIGFLMTCVNASQVSAQQNIRDVSIPVVQKSFTTNVQDLAMALGKDASSEKILVDRIFFWVINNIQYDTKLYYSGKGIQNKDVDATLKKRRGVCGDFSILLDTLFKLNGLESFVVTGYLKEVYFDIGDPIYFSNHVWNAIKINRTWYLCDPTLCSTIPKYEYTKFSKWRLTKISQLRQKRKAKTSTSRIIKDKACFEKEKRKIIKTDTVTKWVPRILITILQSGSFKVKLVNSEAANLDYYLTKPEVFAMDHFPDSPIWSLQSNYQNVEDFSKDSIYYFKAVSDFSVEERRGVFCLDCDRQNALDERSKIVNDMKSSESNNPLNVFLQANGQFKLARYTYSAFLEENDSLTKMTLMDSVLNQLKVANRLYRLSKVSASKMQRYQTRKNKSKKKECLKDNNELRKSMGTVSKAFHKEYIKSKSLNKKVNNERKQYLKSQRLYNKARNKYYQPVTLSEERSKKLAEQQTLLLLQFDSIHKELLKVQQTTSLELDQLNPSIEVAYRFLSPITNRIEYDSYLRRIGLMDHQDEIIDTVRWYIFKDLDGYIFSMDSLIVRSSKELYSDYKSADKLERKLIRKMIQLIKASKKLNAYGLLPDSVLQSLDQKHQAVLKDNMCWLAKLRIPTKTLSKNLKSLRLLNRQFGRTLSKNYSAENARFRRVEKYIGLTKNRVTHASKTNSSSNRKLRKQCYRERQKYLRRIN